MLTKLKALQNHAGFMRYFKNTSWMMGEQFLRIIAGLFVGIWVARYLGPEQFGLFSYVLAFTAIFGGIAKLGLDGIMVRELVNHPEKRDTYLGTAFWLKVIGAFLVMGIMAAIVPFTSNDATTNLFIFIIAAGLVFQSFEVVEFYFQSQVLAKIVSICKVIQLALSSMIKIYLVLTEAELIYFVLVTAFDALSLAVSYFLAYKIQKNPAFYKHFDLKIASVLIKSSFPMMLSTLLIAVYMKSDVVMIKHFLGDHSVGIYSVGTRLVEAVFFLPIIILASIFPAIISAKNESEYLFYERLQHAYTIVVWLGICLTSFFILFNNELIVLLFGSDYQESSSVLIIYCLVIVPLFLSVANDKWFYVENRGYLLTVKIFIGAFSNIILNYIFIPRYGVEGAAYATVISFYISVMLSDLFFRSLHKTLVLKLKAFFPIYLLKGCK